MDDHGRSLKKFTILSLITKIPFKKTLSSKGYFKYYCQNLQSIPLWIYKQHFYNKGQTTGHNKRQERQNRRHRSTSSVTFSRGSIIVWAANGTNVYSESKCWYKRLCEFCGDICWNTRLYQHQWTPIKRKWPNKNNQFAVFSLLFTSERKCTAARNIYLCPIMLDLLGNKGSHSSASISWQITGQKQMSDMACLNGDSQWQTDETRLSFIDSHVCWYCLDRLTHDTFSFAICSLT